MSKNIFDGVGKIDSTRRIMTFTTGLYDFNQTVLNSNDLTLKNVKEPALFVVKKNRSILRNLESWLSSNNADPAGKIDLPLLMIDDEADNASVNTRKNDQDPTAINAAIRSILHRFYRSSYVGVTATCTFLKTTFQPGQLTTTNKEPIDTQHVSATPYQ